MLFITHFETHEFAQILMLFEILGSKSTHEDIILLPPAPWAQQQNSCFFSVLLDSHPTKDEVTLAFRKKGLFLHIRVKSSIFLFITYLGPGHHWWKKLWQLEKPRENSSVSCVDKPSSFPQYTQYQQVWKHMEQKDLLNRQREGIHFNENCGGNLDLIKTNKKPKQTKQPTNKVFTTDISGDIFSWQQFYDQSTFYLKWTKNPHLGSTQQFWKLDPHKMKVYILCQSYTSIGNRVCYR